MGLSICRRRLGAVVVSIALIAAAPALADFTQQGPKLIGTGGAGAALNQGFSVALSADGNTMLVGGYGDNGNVGAAWVFTRSGGTWTQQGSKLVGTGNVGSSVQGYSVALSGDGNTALIGGRDDNGGIGAAWVFTRSGGTWTQQGAKFTGTGAVNVPCCVSFGGSVALSADGNTALISGRGDNNFAGATWVFTRSGGTWTQQGNKLVGSGATGNATQGRSVALSGDGNTALIGGNTDNGNAGATWVFTRSGGTWTQQGLKLVGSGATGNAIQGNSVALSGDGNTALIGGNLDNGHAGATWVFTRSGGTWTQQGAKLVGTGVVGSGARQGSAVALSGDGNTALIGAPTDDDNNNIGATWVFTRAGATWTQQGSKLIGTGAAADGAQQGSSVALSADGFTAAAGGVFDNNFAGATWVFVQPGLGVSPASNIAMSGNAGGPVNPPSFDYTLSAPGTAVDYTISGVPDWLTVSTASGSLAAGASVIATFSANATANAKTVGTYGPTTITIANTTNGLGTTTITATLTVSAAGAVTLVSAVLPASRSVQVGTAATAFATVINTAGTAGTNCGLGLGSNIAAGFKYQTTDPATNAVTGTANTPANIPAGAAQSYVFAITPSAAFNATDVPITAGCANSGPAPTVIGLNTLLLSASATPVPDIVALAASTDPGYVDLPGANGTGAFSVATVNVGAAATITVSADTGSTSLPVAISLCQTNAQAQCTNPSSPAPTATVSIAANATPTFSIFVTGSGTVANDPAKNRVFVRFKDGGGVTRGSTSVAVRTQ